MRKNEFRCTPTHPVPQLIEVNPSLLWSRIWNNPLYVPIVSPKLFQRHTIHMPVCQGQVNGTGES